MRQKIQKFLLVTLVLTGVLFSSSCNQEKGINYADTANWAYLPELETQTSEEPSQAQTEGKEEQKQYEADCFLICPTVYFGDETHYNMEMTDEETKANFYGALNMERGIYDMSCNMYAPYYRQASLSAYQLTAEEREQYLASAYQDIRLAFEYYMKNYNDGRPIVLAGFSQGADMVLRLLEEYFADNGYQNRLVAAYVIGGAVTEEDLKQYPHLKMAEAEADTGCIISFNSEAPEANYSILVPNTTLGINPLNWKTDSTEAEASLNKGACFTDYSGAVTKEIPGLCGAYLDEKRGTLKVTGITPEEYPPVLNLFDSGIYHLYDYQFFYRNLQENVAVRLKQYQTEQFLKKNYAVNEMYDIHRLLSVEQQTETEAVEAEQRKEAEQYLIRIPEVTMEMLEPEFWIQKVVNPDQVIMSQEEIVAFNGNKKGVFAQFSQVGCSNIISGTDLKTIVEELGQPKGERYLNGTLLEQDYWDVLLAERNVDSIQQENQVQYGISTKRTAIRTLPSDDILADAPEFTFFDEMQNSSVMINEPVLVMQTSKSGNWYYVLTRYCGGWMHKEDVALCRSQKEWLEAQPQEDFLVVTGDKLRLEYDPVNPAVSEYELSMGSRYLLAKPEEFPKSAEGRYAVDNYIIKLPTKAADGYLQYEYAYIQKSQDVHIGYLPYTRRNLLTLAFKADGDRYGWAGMYNARDCSQYMMELYRCFGINLARNSSGQASTKCKTLNVAGLSDERKQELLKLTPAGSILYFPGHIMMYLGEVDGHYYVISSAGSFRRQGTPEDVYPNYHSVLVNDLSVVRKNGKTWLESLAKCKIIWENEAEQP